MLIKVFLNKQRQLSIFRVLGHKELLIALYFLLFILGITTGIANSFYNEFRVLEVFVLLLLGLMALFYQRYNISSVELLFIGLLVLGSFFWEYATFVITDLLLAYLLYKSFRCLNYNKLITKAIVLLSLLIFLLLPIALWDYISTGVYGAHWYPLPWNIRVYDSYFLIISIFAVFFYLTEKQCKNIYLLFCFLAFFAVLLDGGRSVTIAYTVFIAMISIFYRNARWPLILVYAISWLSYIVVTFAASLSPTSLGITRESSSGRIDLWQNALQCWLQHPIIGCGFYQLDKHPHLSAHPHNLFIQVFSETGLLGFGFLLYVMVIIIKRINWQLKQSYFVIVAFLTVAIDLSFSGIHVYPITQMALLWLFVFLLKNPEFSYTKNSNQAEQRTLEGIWPIIVYLILSIWFVYLFNNTSAFSPDTSITPPRFWGYGYQLW